MSARAARQQNRMRHYQQSEAAAADLMRWLCGSSLANELGMDASPVVPHQNLVRTAQCTCPVGGRSILYGAMSARAARQESRMRYYRGFEAAATDLMQWPSGRAMANDLGRIASRVVLHHNQV